VQAVWDASLKDVEREEAEKMAKALMLSGQGQMLFDPNLARP
jgi:hypothetical protein